MSTESRKIDDDLAPRDDEVTADDLGDTQLGESLGQLLSEISRDEASLKAGAGPGDNLPASDPFDPSEFTLDGALQGGFASETAPPAFASSPRAVEDTGSPAASGQSAGAAANDSDATVAQAVSEIETALHRFAQAERERAESRLAEKEAQVADQYRRLKSLADKVARQKVEIQRAKHELREKLEVADRLHMEFDGIRRVLDGQLGVLDALDKEEDG